MAADRSGGTGTPPASDGWLEQPAAKYAEPMLRDLSRRDGLREAAPPPALVSALADRYTVGPEIGGGSMATVYLARDLRFDRAVAIKVLRAELARDCDIRHFRREIARTAQLNHPHIVPVFDTGDPGGPLFYVMPYMEGGTLRRRLARERRLQIATAVAITRVIAQALECAHGHGLVHRDVKPENILFTSGQPSLADFGIARALDSVPPETWSSAGIARGTVEYMSPEQIQATMDLDGRSDVYALACVLYEMVAGDPPFTSRNPLGVMRRHLQDEPAPLRVVCPALPEAIELAVRRGLAKSPGDRPPTAVAFAESLGV